jgi:putative transposase
LALETWDSQYDASVVLNDKSIRPNMQSVRNELVRNKEDWQYGYPITVLQQAVINLAQAWKNFFSPNMPDSKKPKFKSAKRDKQSFATNTARIMDGKLILPKPIGVPKGIWYGIHMSEPIRFTGEIKLTVITKDVHGYSASLMIDTEDNEVPVTKGTVGIDANIKRFNYGNKEETIIYPKKLDKLYDRIGHYQKMLARKRIANPAKFRSKNYAAVRDKLQRDYSKVNQIQSDILHKFTYYLTHTYKEIHIEDLDVKHMQMSRKMDLLIGMG